MLDESGFAGDGLAAFKTAVNRTLRPFLSSGFHTFFLSHSFIILDSLLSCVIILIHFFPFDTFVGLR